MEIEVGEFVRTKSGFIGKVIAMHGGYGLYYELNIKKEIQNNMMNGIVYEDNLVKHSKQLIDLIEVGDIVKVLFNKKTEEILTYTIDCEADLYLLTEENLKTILTHEQFEKNAFRLEE